MDLALNNLQWLICHKTKLNFAYFKVYYYLCFIVRKINYVGVKKKFIAIKIDKK